MKSTTLAFFCAWPTTIRSGALIVGSMSRNDDDEWVEVVARARGGQTKRGKGRECDDDGGDEVVFVPAPPRQRASSARDPFVLILVGIPGSGKSHFAEGLVAASANFRRINQDRLKTRKKCEAMALKALAEGKVAVIDRCNFNAEQRKTWVDIAKKQNVNVECVVFTAERDECIARCQKRRNHETLHPSKVVGGYNNDVIFIIHEHTVR